MGERALRLVIVVSTGGSVMNALLANSFFRRQVFSVVSDRECAAIERAECHGVPTAVMRHERNEEFSANLQEYLHENKVDYVVSFFTRLFVGELVTAYKDRIINLHPSLLPAFKGLDGFGDTMRSGVRYLGTTIHFVDEQMDEGKVIIQSICPLNPRRPVESSRHIVFQQQCKSLLQVVKWLSEDRVCPTETGVEVIGATYADLEFSPSLDFPEAIGLSV